MILTLTNGQPLFLNPYNVVAWHPSVDPTKPSVTVLYTEWKEFPFEVTESSTTINNYMESSIRALRRAS